jgi:large subunit ribosomal protein L21
MFAVIKTGGKQYRVKENEEIMIEKLPDAKGESVVFNEVLLVAEEDGREVKIGTPFISDAKVEGRISDQVRGKKISVVKYKPKVRYRRRVGHRQQYTKVKIERIVLS